jgi:hypothetical protein
MEKDAKINSSENSLSKDKVLHDIIEAHRKELRYINDLILEEAKKQSRLTSCLKSAVIFLGAFVAIKEVTNQLVGISNTVNIIIFTLAGLLIVVLTGLEAAFKWENTSAQLRNLAAAGHAVSRNAASNLARVYATKQNEERLRELENILDAVDTALADTHKKASELGVNIDNLEAENIILEDPDRSWSSYQMKI